MTSWQSALCSRAGTASSACSADIWSLGVVLYELLQGAPPFGGDTFSSMVLKVVNDPLPRLTVRLPDELDSVVYRCLEKDPARRFQDVAALALALARYAQSETQAAISVRRTRSIVGAEPAGAALEPGAASHAAPSTLLGAAGAHMARRRGGRRWPIAAAVAGLIGGIVAVVVASRGSGGPLATSPVSPPSPVVPTRAPVATTPLPAPSSVAPAPSSITPESPPSAAPSPPSAAPSPPSAAPSSPSVAPALSSVTPRAADAVVTAPAAPPAPATAQPGSPAAARANASASAVNAPDPAAATTPPSARAKKPRTLATASAAKAPASAAKSAVSDEKPAASPASSTKPLAKPAQPAQPKPPADDDPLSTRN